MNWLRSELCAKSLPLILGEISECTGERWNFGDRTKAFNIFLHELAAQLPNCAVASQTGLTLRPEDGIHFDSPSCREFGKRYYHEYIELTK